MPLVLLLWETIFLVVFEASWIFQRVTLTLVWIIWMIKTEMVLTPVWKRKKKNTSCIRWNIWAKYFFAFVWELVSMFMLLPRSHQILNVVAHLKRSLFLALMGLSKNNTKIICHWMYSVIEGFLDSHSFFSQVPPHFTNTAGSVLTPLLSERREIDPVQPYRCWAWHRQEEEAPSNPPDTLACARTKTMLGRRHYWRDHAVPALPPSRQF